MTGNGAVGNKPVMVKEDVKATVHKVLIEEFEIAEDDLKPDAHLFQDLGLDSLDAVDLIVALEAAFGGRVPEEEAKKVRSVGDVYALVTDAMASN